MAPQCSRPCSQLILYSSPIQPLFQPHLFPTPLLSIGKVNGGSSLPSSRMLSQ